LVIEISLYYDARSKRHKKMTGMQEAPENGKESSHSAHANGMNK